LTGRCIHARSRAWFHWYRQRQGWLAAGAGHHYWRTWTHEGNLHSRRGGRTRTIDKADHW